MRILVTAGPTREYIDDVRYVGNASSGRLGFAIARAAVGAGHDVTLVRGPVSLPEPEGPRVVPVVSAAEMRAAVLRAFPAVDAVFMCAAVADYRPETRIRGKRKKAGETWDLRLVRNPDILRELGERKERQVLVGFALEAGDGRENALGKLREKNLDAIVLNAPETIGADTSDFTLFLRDGSETPYISVTKDFLALGLVSLVTEGRLKPVD